MEGTYPHLVVEAKIVIKKPESVLPEITFSHWLNIHMQHDSLPESTVLERGLVVSAPKWKDITSNNHLYSTATQTTKQFHGLSLAYVTPVRNTVTLHNGNSF